MQLLGNQLVTNLATYRAYRQFTVASFYKRELNKIWTIQDITGSYISQIMTLY